MSELVLYSKKSPQFQEVDNEFIVSFDGQNDPTIIEASGLQAVVYGGSAGQFVFTFSAVYCALRSAAFQLQAAIAVDLVPQIRTINLATRKMTIELMTGATATDPPAASDNATRLHGRITWRNSPTENA